MNRKVVEVVQELVIENASCLRRLIVLDPVGPTIVRVIEAPKLAVLGYTSSECSRLHIVPVVVQRMVHVSLVVSLRTVKILALNSGGPNLAGVLGFLRCFPCTEALYIQGSLLYLIMFSRSQHSILQGKKMVPTSLVYSLRTVKILALKSVGLSLDAILAFLRCFPCTEKLYIQPIEDVEVQSVFKHDKDDLIECLRVHLVEVTLNDYRWTTLDVGVANFYILSAVVLKIMRIGVFFEHEDERWAIQHRRLLLEKRLFHVVDVRFQRVQLKFGRFGTGGVKKIMHDLKVADPFAASL